MAHILIVDDDQDILRLMQFTLEKAGHQVLTAIDGPQAINTLKQHKPHLVVADIMMPEMTGYELTRQIRALPQMDTLPILIYSARFQPVDRQAALAAGATDYIPKTVSPTEIVKRVDQLLKNNVLSNTGKKQNKLAFFSLRGGVGVSGLAVNIAVALALSQKIPVSITDLNPLAGHAGLMLGLRPKSNVHQILASDKSLSPQTIQPHLVKHKSGVYLLASPLTNTNTSPQHTISQVISQLDSLCHLHIFDMPHTLTDTAINILPEVTRLVLVLSPDVPSLQSAVAAIQLLTQNGLDSQKIIPVLNRNSSFAGLSVEAIEKTIRRKLATEIPFESKMSTSINNGHPLVLHSPKSATTTAIARLAVNLIK